MSTTDTTHDTAWLGDLAAELTGEQVASFNRVRTDLGPVDHVLEHLAREQVAANRDGQRTTPTAVDAYAVQAEDNRMDITTGSEYILTMAEAAELAHVLLAAVDVATTGVQA